MKRIILAGRGRRMLASLLDALLLVLSTLLIYFTAVMPFTFDSAKIKENNLEILNKYQQCDLYVIDSNNNIQSKNEFKEIKKLEDLYNVTVTFNGEKKTYSITKALYVYYTQQHADFAGTQNYDDVSFKRDILKAGTIESNIKDFDTTTYQFSFMNENRVKDTFDFTRFLYRQTTKMVSTNGRIGELSKENNSITMTSFSLILPVLFGFSFIYYFLIPICSPFGQTIGKHVFKLILLDKNGYHLKKGWLVPRWLMFIIVEFVGGILTFGGFFLISYTMFLFNKKRRSLHDMVSNSVVVDRRESIFFKSPEEERHYKEIYDKNRGSLNA